MWKTASLPNGDYGKRILRIEGKVEGVSEGPEVAAKLAQYRA